MSYGFAQVDGPEINDLSLEELVPAIEEADKYGEVEHVECRRFYAWSTTMERGVEFIPYIID